MPWPTLTRVWPDMLSLLIIGNSESRVLGPYMLTPRGYARKHRQ